MSRFSTTNYMEQTYINFFLEDDQRQIKMLYDSHRDAFLAFGKKYQLSQDALIDIYQDAFIILRRHAIAGNLGQVTSTLKTYLFGIGKNLIYNELKRQKKFVPIQNPSEETYKTIHIEDGPILTEEQRLLQQNFKKLGKKCQEMLTMFYYRGLTIKEIAEEGGYKSEVVTRSQKSRCLKTLKEFIKLPKL